MVLVNRVQIHETDKPGAEGWIWEPLKKGGILKINHQNGNDIAVVKQ
jgi:hypothetical protein